MASSRTEKSLKRIGPAYEVIGVFNPLGMFPARVYPIYQLKNSAANHSRLFRQIHDAGFIIQDFLEIRRTNYERITPIFGDKLLNWINQKAILGFALGERDVYLAKDIDEYKSFMRGLLSEKARRSFFKDPILGVEISRFLENYKLESVFAGIAVRQIYSLSSDAAQGWLAHAPLSKGAEERGKLVLQRIIDLEKRGQIPKETECLAYLTPRFKNLVDTHKEADPRLVYLNGLAEYFARNMISAHAIVFLHWSDLLEVEFDDITRAGEIGVHFVIYEDRFGSIFPKFDDLPYCLTLRPSDSYGLKQIIQCLLDEPILSK